MFIYKFLNSITNIKIKLQNAGMNYRDFMYVEDLTKIISTSIKKLNINFTISANLNQYLQMLPQKRP